MRRGQHQSPSNTVQRRSNNSSRNKPTSIGHEQIPVTPASSETYIDDELVERTGVEYMPLPIVASASLLKLLLALLSAGLVTLFTGLLLLWAFPDLLLHGSWAFSQQFDATDVKGDLYVLFLLITNVMYGSTTIVQLWDLLQLGPLLILEKEGLRDLRRSPDLIPWAEVEYYRRENTPKLASNTGMTLFLRHPAPAARNRLRWFFGALARFRLPRRDRIYVAMIGLTIPRTKLCHACEHLIERHGGKRRDDFALALAKRKAAR